MKTTMMKKLKRSLSEDVIFLLSFWCLMPKRERKFYLVLSI
jgi:hypothetical protein